MPFELATTKNICENRIRIDKYYGFIVVVDSVSSLKNN